MCTFTAGSNGGGGGAVLTTALHPFPTLGEGHTSWPCPLLSSPAILGHCCSQERSKFISTGCTSVFLFCKYQIENVLKKVLFAHTCTCTCTILYMYMKKSHGQCQKSEGASSNSCFGLLALISRVYTCTCKCITKFCNNIMLYHKKITMS